MIDEGELFEVELTKNKGILIDKGVNAKVLWVDNMKKSTISMGTLVKLIN
tara:strand:+ start:3056 stop:3205 length:150 start_codon:yes stop_codon:yes gene_type:complete